MKLKNKITKLTGGLVTDFWNRQDNDESLHFKLSDSFVSESGEYLGTMDYGKFYIKNRLIVNQDNPLRIAIKLKNYSYIKGLNYRTVKNTDIVGFAGLGHGTICIFKIGDRFFDTEYVPTEKTMTKKEWTKLNRSVQLDLIIKVNQGYYDSVDNGIKAINFAEYLPNIKRGSKLIKDLIEAEQSALAFSHNSTFSDSH